MRFDELDLEDEILDGLEDMNFHEMTPVQEHTIPVILEGRDIIGCAQTGTGKSPNNITTIHSLNIFIPVILPFLLSAY